MKSKNIFIIATFLIALTVLVAADFTPQGNINLRDYYNLTGALYINSTLYYGNGSQLTGVIGSANSSDYWDNMNTINTTQMENSGGVLNILESWLKSLFYTKAEVNTNIENANTSVVNWVDLLFPRFTELVNQVGNWSADKSDYYTWPVIDAFNLSHWTDDLGDRGYTDLLNFTNSPGFYNSTDFEISNYYLVSNPFDYYNSTNPQTEIDPYWTANQSSYSTTADIIAFGYYNSSDFVITDYFTKSDIEGFNYYNSTDFSIADYFTSAEVLAFDYYNSSDFDILDYVTSTTLLGYNYYNSTDFSISDYATNVKVDSIGNFTAWNKDYNDLINTPTFTNDTWVDTNFVRFTELVGQVGNWTSDKVNYYTSTQTDTAIENGNTTLYNWIVAQDYLDDYTETDSLAYNGTLAYLSDILGWDYYNSTDFSISDYYTKVNINSFDYYNSTDFDYNDYYLDSNPDNFIDWSKAVNGTLFLSSEYNASGLIKDWTVDLSDYPTLDEIIGFNYYNSTDFDYNDYYLKSNPFSFYNITNAPTYINDTFAGNYSTFLTHIDWSDATNGTLALSSEIPTNNNQLTNGNNYWNDTYATFNKTYGDTIYSPISEPLSLHLNQDNWFNDSNDWIYWDNPTITFNESKLETTYYLASAINVVTGTGAGSLADIQTYNVVTYNVTEVNSDFELIVNFTGITDFTTLLVRHKIDTTDGHNPTIQIWDYTTSSWEGYGYLSELTTSKMQTLGVYDADEHISGGVVQVRFYLNEIGNAGHVHQFDWVGLSKGYGTPVGEEIDPIWVAEKSDYYTSAETDTEIGSANTSVVGWADGKFVVNSGGDSLSGQYDFNGGWTSSGLSIINGNLYAQTGYFYNISGLDVNDLRINGSLLPTVGFDNQFDIGNSTLKWKDLYLGGKIFATDWTNVSITESQISDLQDYYLNSNPFSFYNSTDFSISDYATNVKVDSIGNFTAWDKDYNDLINTPTIPILWDSAFNTTGDSRWLTSVAYNDLTGSPADRITTNSHISWDGDILNVADDWWNAYSDFMGTTTTDKWCKWDGSQIDCNVEPVTDTTYSAGEGISLSTTTFSVAGGDGLTQETSGLKVTPDGIGNTQLEYDTGQALTTTSNPQFNNVTSISCLVFDSGGQICSN